MFRNMLSWVKRFFAKGSDKSEETLPFKSHVYTGGRNKHQGIKVKPRYRHGILRSVTKHDIRCLQIVRNHNRKKMQRNALRRLRRQESAV